MLPNQKLNSVVRLVLDDTFKRVDSHNVSDKLFREPVVFGVVLEGRDHVEAAVVSHGAFEWRECSLLTGVVYSHSACW